MKKSTFAIMAGLLLAGVCSAQIEIPANPGKFKSRTIGGGTSGGVGVIPKEKPKVRYTTYVVLSESRQWTSVDGKIIAGKLIAFENLVVEGTQGDSPSASPEAPAHPTVVRDGKARLLVNHKAVEVPLERLVQADRDFIEQTRVAHQMKTPPTP